MNATQRPTPTDVYRMVFSMSLRDFGYNQPVVTTKSGRKAIKSAKKIAKQAVKHFKKTGQVPSSGAINKISAMEAHAQQIPMAGSPGFGGMGGGNMGGHMGGGNMSGHGGGSMGGIGGGMGSTPRKQLSRSERRKIAQQQKRVAEQKRLGQSATPGGKRPSMFAIRRPKSMPAPGSKPVTPGSKPVTPGAKRSDMFSRRQRSMSPTPRPGMFSRKRSMSPVTVKRPGMTARSGASAQQASVQRAKAQQASAQRAQAQRAQAQRAQAQRAQAQRARSAPRRSASPARRR